MTTLRALGGFFFMDFSAVWDGLVIRPFPQYIYADI